MVITKYFADKTDTEKANPLKYIVLSSLVKTGENKALWRRYIINRSGITPRLRSHGEVQASLPACISPCAPPGGVIWFLWIAAGNIQIQKLVKQTVLKANMPEIDCSPPEGARPYVHFRIDCCPAERGMRLSLQNGVQGSAAVRTPL